jgi:transcription elongation factor GreA
MDERFPMTPRGQQNLKDELRRLKEERPRISLEIEEARGHGDLSENAEYHAAKEKQGHVEARIRELEGKLALAQVIDPATLSGTKVVFGATVTLSDTDTDESVVYRIVGEDESDVKQGLISVKAPLARAMIGRELGDAVRLKTAKGTREYEITDVKFESIQY